MIESGSNARATLAALGLLGFAVAGGAVARSLLPDLPSAVIFVGAAGVASVALLLPSFRRIAAVEFLYENDVFFVAGALSALAWANLSASSYARIADPLRFVANDVLMALFFGIAAKEVRESLLPGGPLSSWKRAALPLVATGGGMAAPAAVYLVAATVLGRTDLLRGWAIPTSTDIAFCAHVARLVFGASHPAVPFLLLLAIADDAAGLTILAVAYPQHELRPLVLLGLVGAGVAIGIALNRFSVKNPWPYVVLGGVPRGSGFTREGSTPRSPSSRSSRPCRT